MERNVLCKTIPVSRQKAGSTSRQSAVAGAAYRAGENLVERVHKHNEQEKLHR